MLQVRSPAYIELTLSLVKNVGNVEFYQHFPVFFQYFLNNKFLDFILCKFYKLLSTFFGISR